MATKQRIPSPTDVLVDGINAFDDLADAIANPDPSRPLRDAVGGSGRFFCNAVGAVPSSIRGALGSTFWTAGLLCKPYWDKNRWTPPQEGLPFSGGQCPASYRPEGTYFNTNAAAGPTGLRNWRLNVSVTGPLRGWASAGSPVGTQWGFLSASSGGAPFGTAVDTGNNKQVFGPNTVGGSSQMLSAAPPTVTNTGISSGTDNCGNAPPTLAPGPNPPPNPGPFPPGQEPGVDPDGQPFFFVPPIPPVGPGAPEVNPPPIGPPPPGGGNGAPPGPAEPGDPEEGTEPEGEAPEDKEIYALVVDFLTVPPFAREIEPGLYVSPCRVLLGTDFGLDLDEAGRAMRSGQAVFAEIDGLSKWRVSASVGYTVRVTPYYREKAS